MKLLFWILVLLAIASAITVVTGYNSYSFSSSGAAVGEASMTARVSSLILMPLFAYGAILVKKGGVHAWWVVTVLWLSACIGFLTNILHGFGEGIGFLIWIVVSQIGCASLAFYYWLTWWLPKKPSYETKGQNQRPDRTRLGAARDRGSPPQA